MSMSIGVWSAIVAPGDEPLVVEPQADIRLTNVALAEELIDASGRCVLKLSFQPPVAPEDDDEEAADADDEDGPVPVVATTVLCSLIPGKIEQVTTDLVLLENEEYLFEVTGKNAVHLTGTYIDQRPGPMDFDSDDDSDDSDEEGYDLRDVSSDVEVPIDELATDSEHIEEAKDDDHKKNNKSAKRPRESDEIEIDDAAPHKKEKKSKKQKGEDGKPVSPAKTEPSEEKKEEKKSKKDKKDKEEKKTAGKEKTLPSGLKYADASVGNGPTAKKGNNVKMRYIGKLTNGTIFDQNTKGKPFSFRLGAGEVIKGWDEGIAGMQAGGERVLTIPAGLAYGKKGVKGIPPNATLVFEVKLLSIS